MGLAVTDPLQLVASALDTVHSADLIDRLKAYFQQEDVEGIVVGLPYALSGAATDNTERVQQFIKHLQRTFPSKWIETVDERFTSTMAQRTLVELGTKKKKREKGVLDRISATIILQSYLASR